MSGHKTGETVTVDFTTQDPSTGALTDADSTPTGTLVVNGVDNGATVTVTGKATGRYRAAVTLPAVDDDDILQMFIAATVGGVSGGGVVRIGQGTTERPADQTDVTAAQVRAEMDANSTKLDATVSSRLASASYTAPPSAAAVASQVDTTLSGTHGAGSWTTATGFSTLSQGDIRTAVGLASANLDAQLADLPTVAEFEARTVLSASYSTMTAAQVNAEADQALADYDGPTNAEMVARTLAAASYATAGGQSAILSAIDAVDNFVDSEVAAVKAVTDKLDTAMALDGAVWQFTVNAMENAPAGGGGSGTVTAFDGDAEAIIDAIHAATSLITSEAIAVSPTVNAAGEFTLRRGDYQEIPITGMGSVAARTKLWLTVKESKDDDDADAILMVIEDEGLAVLNGSGDVTASDASVTVTDEGDGDIVLTVKGAAAAQLREATELPYDVQVMEADGPRTVTESVCHVAGDVTRATE